ncbi:stonin-1 [Labeo rohita]|uniref:Stonin-1 n=1 Tax=Labeo rohita TaxID=84645 RepID=A0A498LEJ9_LABRO|nr:stonin-1 [Labeo rohita]
MIGVIAQLSLVQVPFPGDWVKVPNSMPLLRQKSLKARMNRNACLGSAHVAESQSVMHVSVGTVKYENVHRAIVWRIERLPPKNVDFESGLQTESDDLCFHCIADVITVQGVLTRQK